MVELAGLLEMYGKRRLVSGCVKWVADRGGGGWITCAGDEVLVGGLDGHESEVEVGSGGQLTWVFASLLMCAWLNLADSICAVQFAGGRGCP